MRGSLQHPRYHRRLHGIIPAPAGPTSAPAIPQTHTRDHPRACGAHMRSRWMASRSRGSSPRMRGSQIRRVQDEHRLGIIPAHAGLTYHTFWPQNLQRDHPRACGAHGIILYRSLAGQGSSPRMRGSHRPEYPADLPDRIIPAHAGLTLSAPACSAGMRDHPRACGAHVPVWAS